MNQGSIAPPRTGFRALAERHPIGVFLVMTFGLGYALSTLVILAQHGLIPGAALPGRFGLDAERAASLLMLLVGLFPAALLATALDGGRPAVRALVRRMLRWRVGLGWWLVAVAALPLTTVALATLLGDTLRVPGASVLAREVVASLVAFLLINLWEEAAWAGFLQTRLEQHHNFFVAAFLTALPFAAIHLPLQVINGNTTPAGIAVTFVALVILGSIVRTLIGAVLRGTGDSLLLAGLLHTSFNRSNNVDGLAADLLVGPNRQLAALLAVVLLTVLIGLRLRARLGRRYRQTLDDLNGETTSRKDLHPMDPNLTMTPMMSTMSTRTSSIRGLIRHRPVAAFLVLSFVGMWLSLLPVLLFGAPMRLFSAIGAASGLALPAFLVTAITGGRVGVRDLAGRALRWRVGVHWYALAILGIPAGVVLIAATFLGPAPLGALADRWTLLLKVFAPEVLIALVTIQLFEEIGWAGFVQHRLQGRHGALLASLLVAPAFALIHLPTYFVGGPITGEKVLLVLVQMLPIALFAVFFRVLITWLYNGGGQSILLAALLHASFNTTSGPGLTPALVPASAAMWLPLAAVAALAALAVVATRGRLGYRRQGDVAAPREVSPGARLTVQQPLV